jgi:hypothetical protein
MTLGIHIPDSLAVPKPEMAAFYLFLQQTHKPKRTSKEVESIRQRFGWTIPVVLLSFLPLFTPRLPAADPSIPCFHILRAVPATTNDSGRYLLETLSTCPSPPVPSIYLHLRFLQPDGTTHTDTWESFHFVKSGKRFYELAYPASAAGFTRIVVTAVTTVLPAPALP